MKPLTLLGTAAALIGLSLSAACASTTERYALPPLDVVPHVELDRYLGTWHEIASFPQRFQEGCVSTTATYSLREDGAIDVLNRCIKRGEPVKAQGKARVVDPSTNAKLEVSFFGPFWGNYWIIDLAEDYSHAVVGEPGRDALWILSRAPEMNDAQYAAVVERVRAKGFDVTRLERTPK